MKSIRTVLMTSLIILAVSYLTFFPPSPNTETISIPGNALRTKSFSSFMYNFSKKDYINYLNDSLLFLERPNGKISISGQREKLMRLLNSHRVFRQGWMP